MEGKGGGKHLSSAQLFCLWMGRSLANSKVFTIMIKERPSSTFTVLPEEFVAALFRFFLRPTVRYKVLVTLLLAPENPALPRFSKSRWKKKSERLSLPLSLSPPAMTHTFPYVWPSLLQTYSFQRRANQLTCVWPTVWGDCVWPLRAHARKQTGGWRRPTSVCPHQV